MPQLLTPSPPPRPSYLVQLDGRDITSLINPSLIELTLNDNRGFEADQLDITLDDSDGLLDIPRRGAEIHVLLGSSGSPLEDKGTYSVYEVELTGAPDKMTIRARSADQRASLTAKREQSWHDTTAGDMVTAIASRSDLLPVLTQ